MLFVNFLDKSKSVNEDGFMGFLETFGTFKDKQGSEEVFSEFDLDYDSKNNFLVVSKAENPDFGSNEMVEYLFRCNDARAVAINGRERNPEEDMVVAVDKVRFIEGVKTYFRVLPFRDGMLFCLFGGAVDFFVGDEWITMNRQGKDVNKNATRYEYNSRNLLSLIRAEDAESGYNMSKDGCSACEFQISILKGTKSIKSKSFKEEFSLLREDKVQKERAWVRRDNEKKEEDRKRKEASRLAFEQRRREQLEEENSKASTPESKAPKAKKGTKSRVSASNNSNKGTEVTAEDFLQLMMARGYKG